MVLDHPPPCGAGFHFILKEDFGLRIESSAAVHVILITN